VKRTPSSVNASPLLTRDDDRCGQIVRGDRTNSRMWRSLAAGPADPIKISRVGSRRTTTLASKRMSDVASRAAYPSSSPPIPQ
jgi:hypothetical protein